eukprot:g12493.t1
MAHLSSSGSSAALRLSVRVRPTQSSRRSQVQFCSPRSVQARWRSYAAKVPMSASASRTVNPIRQLIERTQVAPNPDLDVIPLSIGDPTHFGNFTPPPSLAKEMGALLEQQQSNGYQHSTGILAARESVARKFSGRGPGGGKKKFPLTADDVILASGCSHALDLAIQVLANPGEHNVLLPKPGFPLYQTLASSRGIDTKHYRLDPARQWEIDLQDMEAQIDEKTACILINSPSNPCGNVFSRGHLEEICRIAEKHQLPLIADEIYANMAFEKERNVLLNEVSQNVPFLSVGGLAKQYMIPGWRMGWVLVHDRNEAFSEVRRGLQDLSTLLLGPSTLQQAAIPHLLEETQPQYYVDVLRQLEDNGKVIANVLADAPGLRVIKPEGAMYVLVELPRAKGGAAADDVAFCRELLAKQSVFALPGQCFGIEGFFRIVTSPPKEKLEEACKRIVNFCKEQADGGA